MLASGPLDRPGEPIGSRGRRSAIRAVWTGPSATTAVAPESPRIHSICSADDVSYTGTVTAPANQMA